MSRKENKTLCHFRLEPKLVKKLETSVGRRGYTSRSSYFTDVALVTVGEKEGGDAALPNHVREWIEKNKPPLTETEIKKHLENIISTMLFPVLALKGADIAHEKAWKLIRTNFREEHGIWITESDIRAAIEEFESLHRAELTDYRNKKLDEGDTP